MNPSKRLVIAGLGLLALACSDEVAVRSADLPSGWERAERVTTFHQTECSGSPYGDGGSTPEESIALTASDATIHIAYHNAHFRCAQTVEGFVRAGAGTFDVLVQPVDMDPEAVAKCDCLYEITLSIQATAGRHDVSVFRRWDHKSGSDTPILVGSATLDV